MRVALVLAGAAVVALAPVDVRALHSTLRDAAVASGPQATGGAEPGAWQTGTDDAPLDGAKPISAGRAILYSLVLPGLGDYALGNRGRAAAFFAVEAGIWISYAVFQVQGSEREDEYQSLAVRFAGVSRTGHTDEFYATIRDYDSSEEYEAEIKSDGRFELYPDVGADALDAWFAENRIDDYEPWMWQSFERRLQYSEVRSSSKTAYRRADYMLAAAAANRVVSAIVAYAAARSVRPESVGYQLNVSPAASGLDVSLALTRSF